MVKTAIFVNFQDLKVNMIGKKIIFKIQIGIAPCNGSFLLRSTHMCNILHHEAAR
jgi:hypothetical protein